MDIDLPFEIEFGDFTIKVSEASQPEDDSFYWFIYLGKSILRGGACDSIASAVSKAFEVLDRENY